MRKFQVTDGQNMRDQIKSDKRSKRAWSIAFCAFHSFFVETQTNAATYMRRMRNDNLETRIAGSSCRRQNLVVLRYFHP